MSRDGKASPPSVDEAGDWLDGLAGRPGAGPAHAQGQQLREALLPSDRIEMPSWTEIERRAEAKPALDGLLTTFVRRIDAPANRPFWQTWRGAAAAGVLSGVLTISMWPAPDPEGLRGSTNATTVEALWRTERPLPDAEAMAAELRSLGALVEVLPDAAGARLEISVPMNATAQVNQRLARLETAVDARGRLTLRVQAP